MSVSFLRFLILRLAYDGLILVVITVHVASTRFLGFPLAFRGSFVTLSEVDKPNSTARLKGWKIGEIWL